jgi:peptidoglycan-associated lipoprotein
VGSSQLNTVSFGEDRPAVQGHDESAWRYNRRAEFVGN